MTLRRSTSQDVQKSSGCAPMPDLNMQEFLKILERNRVVAKQQETSEKPVVELTIGELIDRLITTSNRCWHAQDKLMELDVDNATNEQLREAVTVARLIQSTNKDRAKLIVVLNDKFNDLALGNQQSQDYEGSKTY